MKIIRTVGVAGAGTMGSALAQKFAQEGFKVLLLDTNIEFVKKGIARISDTLYEGVERKMFSPQRVEEILGSIKGTIDIRDMSVCDLVIEAIFENFDAKSELFKKLDFVLPHDTIIATNTSSFSVTALAENVSNPERFIGVHYFYHAAKNRLVEIIPGAKTSNETFRSMEVFSVQSGKDAITCKDAYGFVVNRYFVPWLNEAVHIFEEGVASAGVIDAVCMKTFSIGMGPFALMNATGVPVAYHAEKTLEHYGNLYKAAEALRMQTEKRENWIIDEVDAAGISEEKRRIISDRMLGVIFFVCSQLLDEKVCGALEINRGARIGLRWRKGPIDLMKKYGVEHVNMLIRDIAAKYNEQLPQSISPEFWKMELVTLSKSGSSALITIARPEDMNALNEQVVSQLEKKFDEAQSDDAVKTIYITGSGKAFVAGADIKFFVDNIKARTIDKIISFTKYCQSVLNKIDNSPKRVIAVLNGLTLGGGLELALSADEILALPNAVLAFPETGIGIYPGLGGTQRTQKKIGKPFTKYMIFTGDMLKAKDAFEIGLVDSIIDVNQMFEYFGAEKEPEPVKSRVVTDAKLRAVKEFFQKLDPCSLPEAGGGDKLYERLISKVKQKAPLALRTAAKLIDEEKGCESELDHLEFIFSSEDALLGLTSIGKKVDYKGK
jgi:enoyl-CoA hydratase/3-hydroxyacyl-CoA dehydrogenase